MFLMIYFSDIFYRKSNTLINLTLSLVILLIINPYNIENIGMWLSLLGTYGIIEIYSKFKIVYKNKLKQYFIQNLVLSFSVQICILPIMIYNFNTISLTFFISNFLISFLIGPIIFIGFIILIIGKIFMIGNLFGILESYLLSFIFNFVNFISNLSISKIYVKTPNIISVFIYYIILFLFLKYPKKIINLIKNRIKRIIIVTIIFILISNINFRRQIQIYFIDVGQGDCTMIKTETNKIILIDGGEGHSAKYDQGKNVLFPYLLDRGINKIDYIIISHFDSDHCGGIFYVMENMKVKNVIIGKQFKDSDNYKYFLELIKEKNIKLQIVDAGKRLNIEKSLYFDILWPDFENTINENILNNNSLVCKLVYRNFYCIFTGDIEEIAEKAILEKYKNNLNILKSDILKVAHHGSITSTSKELLYTIQPQIALIGVGKDNNFGHPSNITLEKLSNNNCKIYRTDECGEIVISIRSSFRR